MITLESVFSKKNQKIAFSKLSTRKNGAGSDRIPLNELREYWAENQERIIEEVNNCTYAPGLIKESKLQ